MRSHQTIPSEDLDRAGRRDLVFRRTGTVVLTLFLLGALLGLYGVRSSTARASAGGYSLEVVYPAVARPGLAAPLRIDVERAGGFSGPVTVAITHLYMDLWDENGIDPEPSASTTMGDMLIWEFDPPDGDRLTISFDARIEPARQRGLSARVAVLREGTAVVEVAFTTRLMP